MDHLFVWCVTTHVKDHVLTSSLLAGRIEVRLNNHEGMELTSSPLETDGGIDPERRFDEWEYVLYIMTLAFLIEGESRPHLQTVY